MIKVLIDTNVLIYAIDQKSVFFQDARDILEAGKYELYTTSKNLTEFMVVATKNSGYGLNTDIASDILEDITHNLEVLYPNKTSSTILSELIRKYSPKGAIIHDFEIVAIGIAHGVMNIATFNTKDFTGINEVSLIGSPDIG
ncbi:MAG: type II toxin-antitoxin system VapC family toxin [Candidatus Cyclonatronum sp.]|uniref:type II toxin-antitoxin system VapC family toxin n=1 Tax=Cyclonatronum sp. TaxID=3024185 RepID=UPI0025C6566B|nr:type II toxin-antitoxin system VapC family toxin [Cyclonatronum sp.]MCC5933662.1 type II toxin-antitoxin system VapC family toxin [Balneolales bacterium]MCH8486167.1 type II toxin-antitoxin system VapC family toxin [Cyclonatronum sp.]